MSEERLLRRSLAVQELARILELDLRRPELTTKELELGCAQARTQGLFAVCVASSRVLQAAHFLEDSPVKVVCSVGTPGGAMDADVKRFETEVAIDNGAHCIEVTANPGRLRDGDESFVLRELRDIVEAAEERPVGVALEVNALRTYDFERVLGWIWEAGAKGLTILGSGGGGDMETVRRAKAVVGDRMGIKFERPQLGWDEITSLLEAGAVRFGSSTTECGVPNAE